MHPQIPKYLYGDTKSGLRTNSTDSTLINCSPFSDSPDFCEKTENNVFFALRIEPTSELIFSTINYPANNILAKDATYYYIEKGKRLKMSQFNCMPMVLVRGKWQEHPELINHPIKEWIDILEEQGLYPYPKHGYGNESDCDTWFDEEYASKQKNL